MYKIKLFLIIALSMTMISCEKFLDIDPKGEVVSDEMFNTSQGCEEVLIGIYSELAMNSLYGENLLWKVPEVLCQHFAPVYVTDFEDLATYRYDEATDLIDEIWVDAYKVIGHVNNAILNFEKKQGMYPFMDYYMGESLGLRAMLHFDMLRYFAPHVERNPTDRGIPYVKNYSYEIAPFLTVEKTYECIIADLKQAQEYLAGDVNNIAYPRDDSAMKTFMKSREIHFNYYAATALLARVYWTMGDMENAKIEALKVIDSKKFPLCAKEDVSTFLAGALSPEETIYGVYSTSLYNSTYKQLQYEYSDCYMPYQDENWDYVGFEPIYQEDLNDGAGTDYRESWFVIPQDNDYYFCHKLVDMKRVANSNDNPTYRGLMEGFTLLRSVEMYYIVAEALLSEGKAAKAESYLNEVLVSRGLTGLSSRRPAIEITKELIYRERHKEFFCEGYRWFDMKKLHLDIASNYEWEDYTASNSYYVLPIPMAELENRSEEELKF